MFKEHLIWFKNNFGYVVIMLFGVLFLSILCPTCEESPDPGYLFFYSPYCSHCQEAMNQRILAYFDWVSVLEPDNADMIRKFNITAVPTFIICGEKYVGLRNISDIMRDCNE